MILIQSILYKKAPFWLVTGFSVKYTVTERSLHVEVHGDIIAVLYNIRILQACLKYI